MEISGKTGLLGLIGSPVGHSGSPAMYNYSFEILDLDYSPIKGPEGNIEYLIHLKNSNEGYTFNEEDYKEKVIKVVEDSHKLNH